MHLPIIIIIIILFSSRSTSSSNVHAQLMTQSMYVPSSSGVQSATQGGAGGSHQRRSSEREILGEPNNRRSTSTQGLDRTGAEGKMIICSRRFHIFFPTPLCNMVGYWGLERLRDFDVLGRCSNSRNFKEQKTLQESYVVCSFLLSQGWIFI